MSATAGISSRAAFSTRAGTRHAPSRIEYSECTCRWTNGVGAERLTGGQSYCPRVTAPFRLPGGDFLRGGGASRARDGPRGRATRCAGRPARSRAGAPSRPGRAPPDRAPRRPRGPPSSTRRYHAPGSSPSSPASTSARSRSSFAEVSRLAMPQISARPSGRLETLHPDGGVGRSSRADSWTPDATSDDHRAGPPDRGTAPVRGRLGRGRGGRERPRRPGRDALSRPDRGR